MANWLISNYRVVTSSFSAGNFGDVVKVRLAMDSAVSGFNSMPDHGAEIRFLLEDGHRFIFMFAG